MGGVKAKKQEGGFIQLPGRFVLDAMLSTVFGSFCAYIKFKLALASHFFFVTPIRSKLPAKPA